MMEVAGAVEYPHSGSPLVHQLVFSKHGVLHGETAGEQAGDDLVAGGGDARHELQPEPALGGQGAEQHARNGRFRPVVGFGYQMKPLQLDQGVPLPCFGEAINQQGVEIIGHNTRHLGEDHRLWITVCIRQLQMPGHHIQRWLDAIGADGCQPGLRSVHVLRRNAGNRLGLVVYTEDRGTAAGIAQGRQFVGESVGVRLDYPAACADGDPFQLQCGVLAEPNSSQQAIDIHVSSSNSGPCWVC
jgi:hypothetical protein